MRRILPLACALLLGALAASPARAQNGAPRIMVTGTVVDSASGNPLFGVAISTTTGPEHTASDSTGEFALSIPGGTAVMVTFTGNGFQTVGQVVTSTQDVSLGRVALLPAVVALAPILASVSRLDERIHRFNGSTTVYDQALLGHAGESDLFEFVMRHAGLRPSPCNAVDAGAMTECFLVRGYPARPQLWVNEARVGQLSMLRVYRPEDMGRIEIYSGGAMVRVYTKQFLEQMARANTRPMPLPRF